MAVEPRTAEARRELVTFGVFGVWAVVAVVALVRGASWSERQLAALAALAAVGQALGVFWALLYARRQIKQSQQADRLRRREELLDRLEAQAFGDLETGISRLVQAWNSAATTNGIWLQTKDLEPENPEQVEQFSNFRKVWRERWSENRKDYREQFDKALVAADRFQRCMRYLGNAAAVHDFNLWSKVESLPDVLPIDVGDELPDKSQEASSLLDALHAAQTWVLETIEADAP